jgi:hypothetical protein
MKHKCVQKRTERQAKNLANVRAINWRLRELEREKREQNDIQTLISNLPSCQD